jgi:ATP-binding cassette subfamily B multidrug efflux pump
MKGEGPFRKYSSRQEKDFRLSQIDKGAYSLFWKYVKPHYPNLLGALVATLLVTICTAAGPYLLMRAIDRHIAGGDLQGLTFIALLYVGVNGLLWAGSYWQSYLTGAVGEKVVYNMRQDLFAHLESFSLDFFVKRSPGEIMSRLINDTSTLSDLISSGMVELIGDLLIIVALMGTMLFLHVKLALLVLVTLPLIYIFTNCFGRKLRKAFHEIRIKIAELNNEVQENITANKVIQALYRNEINIEKFEVMNKDNMKANLRAMGIFALFFPLIFFIGSVGTALILWYGGRLAAGGVISVGLLVAFLQYTERFYRPVREISQVFNVIQAAGASLDRVYEYLQLQPEIEIADAYDPDTIPLKFKGRIDFCNVTFAYGKNPPVLKNINLHFELGSTAALVGLSGAGKTTVVKLLARFYEPREGHVLIDGVDINKIPAAQLRKILAVVPQEPFLFSTTIMENLRYGNPSISDEKIIKATKELGVHQLIETLPNGYQTKVGRRGERLSGGQKQIIALLRGFLSDPLILVLDEATSSLDSATETIFKEALRVMLKNKTGVIIAHRFMLLELAERIYVLQEGNIVASGRQEHVYRQSPLFRKLYSSQIFLEGAVHQ